MAQENTTEYKSVLELPDPPKVKGVEKIIRHLKQIVHILFSKEFRSYDNMIAAVDRSYELEGETSHWKSVVDYGLHKSEMRAFEDTLESMGKSLDCKGLKILFVGCGGGRECFAFEKMGHSVVGVDISSTLVSFCRSEAEKKRNSTVFYCGKLHELDFADEKFDIIFTTNVLLNLIPGKRNRLKLLRACRKLCHDNSRVMSFNAVEDLDPRYRLFWNSFLLRAKSWLGLGEYERGDVATASVGTWDSDYRPILFHFYLKNSDHYAEYLDAGFESENLWGSFWLSRPVK